MSQASATKTWLQRVPSATAAGRVFCIPQAGCGSSVFTNWPQEQDSIEFLPIELPGRLTRFGERMPETFQDLARDLVAGLEPYLDRPFAFFGHCWSTIAAYEVTARLERLGLAPAGLFVSAEVAPQVGPYGRMLDMNDAELADELRQTIRDLGQHPHPELVAIYLNVLRDDVEVRRRYVASAPLRVSCPITVFGWTEDTVYRPEQLAGWAECGDTTFEVFAGQHLRFVDAPPELLSTICAGLRTRAL